MKFAYRAHIGLAPETGESQIILRPEVLVQIAGPNRSEAFLGLVDSGADNTVLPTSIADRLGIQLRPAQGPSGIAFGGHELVFQVGQVEFELSDDQTTWTWKTEVLFHQFEDAQDETLILGHAGFLDFFRTLLDPEQAAVELTPNGLFPSNTDHE